MSDAVKNYLTPGTKRQERTRVNFGDGGRDDVGGSGAYTHMTLLARNNTGMHNLFRMSSLASLEGHYFKPRIDRERGMYPFIREFKSLQKAIAKFNRI